MRDSQASVLYTGGSSEHLLRGIDIEQKLHLTHLFRPLQQLTVVTATARGCHNCWSCRFADHKACAVV